MKPVAYLHIMHQEGGQKEREVTFIKANPFGLAGRDYSKTYKVTTEPLYRRTSPAGEKHE